MHLKTTPLIFSHFENDPTLIRLVTVPIFDNIRPSSFDCIFAETEMAVLVTTSDKVRSSVFHHPPRLNVSLCTPLFLLLFFFLLQLDMILMDRTKYLSLRVIIVIDSIKEGDRERGKLADLTVLGFAEVEEKGQTVMVEAEPSEADEVVTVVYTPGTSGTSKGVMLTHNNILAALGALETLGNNGALVKVTKVC